MRADGDALGAFVVNVTEKGAKPFASAPDQPKVELIPEPNGSFFTMDEGIEITFPKDHNGKVTGVLAVYGGQKVTLRRVEQSGAQTPRQ